MSFIKKYWKRLCILSCGAYALFFIIGSLIYPKLKINQFVENTDEQTFNEEQFFNIKNTDEQATVFTNRDKSLALRLKLIDQAQHTLWITQYSIENDASGDVFIYHILKAAQRGVKVKLLLNGMAIKWRGNSLYKKWSLISHPNITLAKYGGVNLAKPWTVNNVMHDKLMIIDNHYFMTSGRNVGNRFMLGKNKDKITNDMDLLIRGTSAKHHPIITAGRNYFQTLWESPYTKSFTVSLPSYITQWSQKKMLCEGKREDVYYKVPFSLNELSYAPIEAARLLHNNPCENIKTPVIFQTISSLLARKETMTLQTPYLVLSDDMYRLLPLKKQTILTNSYATSPNLFAYACYLNNKAKDLNHFNIMEYQGEGSLHNKGFITEDYLMGIGSYNTDMRSTFLDSENLLVLKGKAITQQLRQAMQEYEKQSLRCVNDTQYVSSSKVKMKKISKTKQLLMKVMQKIIKPFSYLT